MSRTFSMNSGSFDSLNVLTRCRRRLNARQMRRMAVWLSPHRRANPRVLGPGPRLIQQSVESLAEKPGPPFADRPLGQSQLRARPRYCSAAYALDHHARVRRACAFLLLSGEPTAYATCSINLRLWTLEDHAQSRRVAH